MLIKEQRREDTWGESERNGVPAIMCHVLGDGWGSTRQVGTMAGWSWVSWEKDGYSLHSLLIQGVDRSRAAPQPQGVQVLPGQRGREGVFLAGLTHWHSETP